MPYSPLCLFGEALLDSFADGHTTIGGAPFNVAWHLSAFGETPRLCSRVGDDPAGQRIRDAMADWGMDAQGVQTDPEHPTGKVRVSIADGEPTYECPADHAYDHIGATPGNLRCDLLYHGTLALRGAGSAQALETLKAGGPQQVFLDVNLRTPWWSPAQTLALVEGADWVKLNQAEFATLTGQPRDWDGGGLAARAAEFRAAYGLTGLIVTQGAAGALAVTATEPVVRIAPAALAQPVDPVGTGAAFAAVLILGLRHGWPLEASLDRAQQFAVRIGGQAGATAADPELYEPFIDQWGLAPSALPSPTPRPIQSPPGRTDQAEPKRAGRSRRA
jgi:fructokinase